MLTATGRRVRALATAAALVLLVAGTAWGDDDHFPFGPFRMYSTTSKLDGEVRAVQLEGVDASGETFAIPFRDVGLRRSEVEGQLPSFISDPTRLRYLADAYDHFGPGPHLVEVHLMLGVHDLEDGRPVLFHKELLATWSRS
ncbi:MAG: hypothetical protein ACRDJI_10245 [Actinomycetota bacterium]